MTFKHNNAKGFTLIELLVVIAIIGLLSSIILASLNSARVKARDTQRVSELRELQKAIELYYDQNGQYPPAGQALDTSTAANNICSSNNPTLSSFLSTWINVPHDPLNPSGDPTQKCGFVYQGFTHDYNCVDYYPKFIGYVIMTYKEQDGTGNGEGKACYYGATADSNIYCIGNNYPDVYKSVNNISPFSQSCLTNN